MYQVQAVSGANKTTIVVIHSIGARLMPWVNHPNIWHESWNSLADMLYGDASPSGRLPSTIAKNLEDYPAKTTADLETPLKILTMTIARLIPTTSTPLQLKVQNTGHADGALVIQLYLSFPKAAGDSPKILLNRKLFLAVNSKSMCVLLAETSANLLPLPCSLAL